MGEKPTNKRVTWSEIFIYRVERGKIQELWVELSQMELLQQLGFCAHTPDHPGSRNAAVP